MNQTQGKNAIANRLHVITRVTIASGKKTNEHQAAMLSAMVNSTSEKIALLLPPFDRTSGEQVDLSVNLRIDAI